MSIDAGNEAVVPHRTIPAAGEVVFARPNDFHGSLRDFCNVHGFYDEVRSGIGAAAKAATEQSRMNLDSLW